jgi:hypothetical protein
VELLKGLEKSRCSFWVAENRRERQTAHTKAEQWGSLRELTGVTLSGVVARGVTVRRGLSDGSWAPAGGEHRDSVMWPVSKYRSRSKAERLSF